jgi:hypothetical protein
MIRNDTRAICSHRSAFEAWLRGRSRASQDVCHILPQSEYLAKNFTWAKDLASDVLHGINDPGRGCNIVLRYEHLCADLAHLSHFAGLNLTCETLPHVHRVGAACSPSPPAQYFLSASVRYDFRRLYASDFNRLGYATI